MSQQYGIETPDEKSSSEDIPKKCAQIIICSFLQALINRVKQVKSKKSL